MLGDFLRIVYGLPGLPGLYGPAGPAGPAEIRTTFDADRSAVCVPPKPSPEDSQSGTRRFFAVAPQPSPPTVEWQSDGASKHAGVLEQTLT